MRWAASIVFACFAPSLSAAEKVLECKLGRDGADKIAVIRDSKIASTHVYYLQQGTQCTPFFDSQEKSRGSDVQVDCVGKKMRALVVSGEFTANALQGFAITQFADRKKPERLDFAEKSRPTWLYLSPRVMSVVVVTDGHGDSDAKYVIYRHMAGNIEADSVDAVNELPPSSETEVVQLKSR